MAVLHIVFMILKIIGILLLVLVGILLLGVLAVLFCPVRYQARGYRDKEHYGGKAGVSWLFHLIFFTVWYDSGEDRAVYEIRIFGIPVLKLLKVLKQRKRQKKRKKSRKNTLPSRTGTDAGKKREGTAEKETRTETPGDTEPSKIREQEEKCKERPEEKERGRSPESKERKYPVFLRKLREIFQIPGKMIKALKNFWLTAGDICDKIKKIKKFLENEKFKRGMSLILQEGKKLLIHMLPGKIQGRIKFGTDDPCLTGEILGAAGIFYPLYGKNFSIEPCFDQTVLEGTVSLRGRMYGIMVLISAVKIIRSRDVRYIIRHFRQ